MTRRQLLATPLFLAASRSSAATGGALKIAQIGTAHAHAAGKISAMRALTDLWTVTGVCEPDAELRRQAEKSAIYAGLPFLDEAALLALPGLKAVAVETRLEDSCATARRCLQAGLHVHLDKPGALNHAEFQAMRLEAAQHGLTVQMGYMLRYNPAFTLLFQAVKEGWLGEITEIDAAMGKLADSTTRQTLGKLEGGGMFELACHVVDAIVTLLGRPQEVHGFSTPTAKDGVKDNQTAILTYPGASAVVRCNHADPFGGPRRRFNVTGTKGTFEIVPLESGKVNLSLTSARGPYAKGTQTFQLAVPKGRYDLEFVDLAAVVRGEKTLGWDAAHDISVHETVLRAAGMWHE